MNKNLTEIVFILDKSGSMFPLIDDTIGGYNGMIDEQKKLDGKAYVTTVLFSTETKKLYDHVDIREVEPMSREVYNPGGGTALLDAIGETIDEVQLRIDNMNAEERPSNVICVITTDGEENSSKTFKKSQIKKMIEHQRNGHGWEFVFLGANIDAMKEASSIGIQYATTYVADSIGTKTVYNAVDCAVSSYRVSGTVSSDWCENVDAYTSAMAQNANLMP